MSYFQTGGTLKWYNCEDSIPEPCFRFSDKEAIESEASLFDSWWGELIGKYGQEVEYLVYKFDMNKADMFYGEDPLAKFDTPLKMIILPKIDESNVIIERFGYDPEDTMSAYIHIKTFDQQFKNNAYMNGIVEPKAGDLIILSEYGSTRPNGRGPKYFEITQRKESNISEGINQLGYSYVWEIKAKRFDFSFEPIEPEKQSHQVYDDAYNENNIPDFGQVFENTPESVLSAVAKKDESSPNKEGRDGRFTYDGMDDLYGGY